MLRSAEKSEKLLGIDYGTIHTGLALSEDGVVVPLRILNSKNFNYVQTEISSIIVKNKVNKIIIGLPLSSDGSENPQSLIVRKFVNNLKKYIKIPFIYVNEYGSTQEFLSNGVFTKISRKKAKKNDHYSAAIILSYYLENLI